MFKSLAFVMLGILAGFGILNYALADKTSKKQLIVEQTVSGQVTSPEILEQTIIDPVEISSPDSTAEVTDNTPVDETPEVIAQKILTAEAPVSVEANQENPDSILEDVEAGYVETTSDIILNSQWAEGESEEEAELESELE